MLEASSVLFISKKATFELAPDSAERSETASFLESEIAAATTFSRPKLREKTSSPDLL